MHILGKVFVFKGNIYSIRIYDRKLSETEIYIIMSVIKQDLKLNNSDSNIGGV